MKEYSVNTLKLLVNGECINLGCFVDLVKNKPINMEQHIASYKHLIGCDFKHINQKGKYIKKADLGLWNIDKGFVSVQDNANYIYQLRSINLYLDDETFGTYKEYMQLHYHEYEHVWKHQL